MSETEEVEAVMELIERGRLLHTQLTALLGELTSTLHEAQGFVRQVHDTRNLLLRDKLRREDKP